MSLFFNHYHGLLYALFSNNVIDKFLSRSFECKNECRYFNKSNYLSIRGDVAGDAVHKGGIQIIMMNQQ